MVLEELIATGIAQARTERLYALRDKLMVAHGVDEGTATRAILAAEETRAWRNLTIENVAPYIKRK